MAKVLLARHAMATRFELVLHGASEGLLHAAGAEALAEIERLESILSLYRPTSEIAHVNSRAATEPVRVSPAVFQLLQHALQISRETGGAFDITVAPLMRAWGFLHGTGQVPSPEELAAARAKVGSHLVSLDPARLTVSFLQPGVMIDLGAIGKGYAVEKAAELLQEAGIEHALIHGGTSTVHAIGHPPDEDTWKIAIELPAADPASPAHLISVVRLRDNSLSVSAVWGKQFQTDNQRRYGHVMDPRTGEPVSRAVLTAVVLPSATETDAFSTALLTAGAEEQPALAQCRTPWKSLVVTRTTPALDLHFLGLDPA